VTPQKGKHGANTKGQIILKYKTEDRQLEERVGYD
jgi:hypothetical protein